VSDVHAVKEYLRQLNMDNKVKDSMTAAVKSFQVKETAKGEMQDWINENFTGLKTDLMEIINDTKNKIEQSEKERRRRQMFQRHHTRGPL
jgi:hypothetical protein